MTLEGTNQTTWYVSVPVSWNDALPGLEYPAWLEPNASSYNAIQCLNCNRPPVAYVLSDAGLLGPPFTQTIAANGTAIARVYQDAVTGQYIDVTFNDLSDATAAPEPSSLLLLGIGLLGLGVWVWRKNAAGSAAV